MPLTPGSNDCLNDSDGDGVCDQWVARLLSERQRRNYSPLKHPHLDDAETLEFWMSSFTLDKVDNQEPSEGSPLSSPQAMSAMASNSCSAGASQLAFCNAANGPSSSMKTTSPFASSIMET